MIPNRVNDRTRIVTILLHRVLILALNFPRYGSEFDPSQVDLDQINKNLTNLPQYILKLRIHEINPAT
jgi:hypothetical protein